jgi:hypothetical protein
VLSQTPRSTTSSGFARRLMRAGLIAKSRGIAYVEPTVSDLGPLAGELDPLQFHATEINAKTLGLRRVNAISLARTI